MNSQVQVAGAANAMPLLQEQARRDVNNIFKSLQAAFPAWKQAFPDDAALGHAKKVWVMALVENGVTDVEMIKRGMREARRSTSPFIPSVGQFIEWCRGTRSITEMTLDLNDTSWADDYGAENSD